MIIPLLVLGGCISVAALFFDEKPAGTPEPAPPPSDEEPPAALIPSGQPASVAVAEPPRRALRRVSMLSKNRQAQLETLAEPREQEATLDAEEAEIRHDLVVGAATIALVAGGYVLPALQLLALPFMIYGAGRLVKFVYDAWRNREPIGMTLLDATVVIGTMLYGFWLAPAASLFSAAIGRYLVRLTRDQSHAQVTALFDRQRHQVWLLRDGVQIQILLEQVRAGDIIVVDAGSVIPVDGVVSAGLARVDQQALTGESQPLAKAPGDVVLAASMVIEGRIEVRAERAGADSLAARLVEIINSSDRLAATARSRGQRILDTCSLPTLGLGVVTVPILGVQSGLAVLDSGFGASLRYSGPLSVLNYLHIASEMGILIKDGLALERLVEVDTIVFDKTGTLTRDRPVLGAITLLGGYDEDEVLALAAAAEQRQDHPIARAIRDAAKRRNLSVPPLEEAAVHLGRGLSVRANGHRITVGSRRLLEAEGVWNIPDEPLESQDNSSVLLAIDGALVASLELLPAIRPEASAVIEDLQRRGLQVVIISGDAQEPTHRLAAQLGIETFYAEVLPDGKAAIVEAMRQAGRKVCFVGDGINDALALRAADVSISLRGATTIATDTALIVMMNSSLQGLGGLLDLAAEFDRNMKMNTAVTLVPGAIALFGIYFLGFGIVAANVLYNSSILLGLINGMLPALKLRAFDDAPLEGPVPLDPPTPRGLLPSGADPDEIASRGLSASQKPTSYQREHDTAINSPRRASA